MSRVNKIVFTLAGCAGFGLILAPSKLLGLFFIHLQRDLGSSASMTSLALGITSSLMFLYGPLETLIFKKCGARFSAASGVILLSVGFSLSSFMTNIEWMTASFGLFSALGLGICNLAWYTMSGQAVPGRLSFVNNMFSTSHALAGFVMAPLTQYLIEFYGWRGTLVLTGGIMFNAVPLSLIMTWHYRILMRKKSRDQINKHQVDKPNKLLEEFDNNSTSNVDINCNQDFKDIDDQNNKYGTWEATKKLLKNRYFVSYAMAMTFASISRISVSLYTVRYAQSTGIDESKTVWIMSLQELLSMLTGPFAGYLTSFNANSIRKISLRKQDSSGIHRRMLTTYGACVSVRRSYILATFSVLFSISIMIPVFFETWNGFLLCGILNGIIIGSIVSLPVTVLSDFIESEDLATAQGIRCFLAGIGLIVYPLCVGAVIDWTGHYRPAQYFAAVSSLSCAGLTVVTEIGMRRRTNKTLLTTVSDSHGV